MNRYITSLFAVLLAIALHSCMLVNPYNYAVTLERAQIDKRDASGEQLRNNHNITSYSDDEVSIGLTFLDHRSIGLTIVNKTDRLLSLDWDKCAFVDALGVTHRIVHTTQNQLAQVPSMILTNAGLSKSIAPEGFILTSPSQNWHHSSILSRAYCHADELGNNRKNRVFLAIKHGEQYKHYDFTLSVRAIPNVTYSESAAVKKEEKRRAKELKQLKKKQ